MLNRLEEESPVSRLRDVLDETQADRMLPSSGPPGWENDLREVARRLARLRIEFPGVAKQVELNVTLVKAGARLNGKRLDGKLRDGSAPESRSQ